MADGHYQDAVPTLTDSDEPTAKLFVAVEALQKKDINLICGLLQNVMSLGGLVGKSEQNLGKHQGTGWQFDPKSRIGRGGQQ